VRLASEGWAERPLRLEAVSKAKFTGEVGPGAEVGIEASLVGDSPTWTCKARLRSGERDVASLTLLLREEP
jgi:3-hydroxymyristoyl/3-hydroxydecanoyl-(acyl carrier protein) dehydratase